MRNLALGSLAAAACLVGCSSTSDSTSNPTGSAGKGASSGGNASSGSGGSAMTQAGSLNDTGGAASGGAAGAAQAGSNALGGAGTAGVAGTNSGAGEASCAGGTPLAAPAVTDCPAAMPAGPPATALATVNDLRAHMGLPCMSLVPAINTSAQKHCDYYQQNLSEQACIANAHEEVDGCAGFVAKSFATRMTAAGYTGSPRSEVMAFSGEPVSAIGQWINSVYHRTPLLSPWLADMGYGMTADCDTIDMGLGPKASDDLTAVYPYPGQVGVPLSFDGSHEGPTPPAPPSGWPSASPVHLYVKSYTVVSHEIFVKGTCDALPHQWLPDKEQYILYPDEPFAKQTEYRVLIKGTKAGQPLDFDWSFTTKN